MEEVEEATCGENKADGGGDGAEAVMAAIGQEQLRLKLQWSEAAGERRHLHGKLLGLARGRADEIGSF